MVRTDRRRSSRRPGTCVAAAWVDAAWVAAACLALASCSTPPAEETAVPEVRAVRVARGTLIESIALPARLQPPSDLDQTLAPQVTGRLVRVAVRQGDIVERGQLLAEVEQADLAGTARAAAAEVEHARREAEAKQRAAELTARLAERGIAAREERDTDTSAAAAATAAQAEAETRLAEAQRNLGRAHLVAPFRGVVVSLMRHAGEAVDGTPATAVLRLAGLERTEAVASSTGDVLARLAAGMRGWFSTAPGTRAKAAGPADSPKPSGAAESEDAERGTGAPRVAVHLVRIARALDPASGLGEIAAEVDTAATVQLFSQGELTLVLGEHPNVVLIPLAAVRRGEDGRDEVVELAEGKAAVHSVRLGARDGGSVEVVEGLAGGETIAAEGGLGIEDGAPVKVAGEETAAPQPGAAQTKPEPADGKP